MAEEFTAGLAAALDQLLEGDVLPPDALPAEQLSMLSEEGRAQLPARRPGRPLGATNLSTRAWRSYIERRFASPKLFMAKMYAIPTDVLARELQCDRLDAAKLQTICAQHLDRSLYPQPVAGDEPREAAIAVDHPALRKPST